MPEPELYFSDGSHPSPAGSYLAACTFYATLFHASPVGLPGKVSGAWVFKNTRTPVAVVFENLEDGMTIDEVMEQYPVTREQVTAVLEFAARSLDA